MREEFADRVLDKKEGGQFLRTELDDDEVCIGAMAASEDVFLSHDSEMGSQFLAKNVFRERRLSRRELVCEEKPL